LRAVPVFDRLAMVESVALHAARRMVAIG
jgi:hypothetical protein